jgi:signal transduction histidine kinase
VRLADFIAANCEPILADWVAFAETCGPAGQTMDLVSLRDHAQAMLDVIVLDLRTPQSKLEAAEKSKGMAAADPGAEDTAAEVHGAGRAESGFTVGEMVAEYRALRASVIRLWTKANGSLTGDDFDDLMRFNEAIDQALAESITRYTGDVESSKEMFMAILGHDLRTPISAISMASKFMLETGELADASLVMTQRIVSSADRMNRMVRDLLDFTRSRLGPGVPISRDTMDLGEAASQAVDEVCLAYPGTHLKLNLSGNLTGNWDAERIGQVITNLLSNAVHHGSPDTLTSITARGERNEVVLQVHNLGPSIPATEIPLLFSPFKRLRPGTTPSVGSSSLGLGLYIVDRIVTAHGGAIHVSSTEDGGTFFTVRIPR